MYSGSFFKGDGTVVTVYEDYVGRSFAHYFTTDSIHVSRGNYSLGPVAPTTDSYGTFNFYFPIFEVVPDISLGDTYNVTTRPTGITGGNYGIVGDNGQITKIEDNRTIINETNNTYYNPATGKTETVTIWTYDYSTRSYNITLESGDTITVTYGDQNITINEGDTIYNIYCIIEGSGSDPDPSPEPTASPDPAPSDSPSPSLPPSEDDPDDMDNGGLLAWINSLIKYLLDHLSGAVELILSFFRKIPELFGGFLDFLSAMFPYLPDDIIFLLTFGIAAVVFIGIIKAIRR